MPQDDVTTTSVRLTRKYAEAIDGVDLSRNQVGDLLNLAPRDARMLIAEGWAAPCERGRPDEGNGKPLRPSKAESER
jgi:hypothetical protein